ncbi:MAG: 50S ribosomal protein L22 [Chlamydiia bacterium]|nr:50S ribosomal protein L22 [Chlamydiia bacterium]MCH9618485.1 50S ribosomal protein L22 [Chlamydiia bacterium]MCH9623774.1 50S ribosomal protein L22 [Chlamydiia bacterium]
MVLAKAITRHAKISPQKARVVIDLIRGLSVEEALFQLKQTNTKSGRLIFKTVNSAVANAVHNKDAKAETLYICEAAVDKGTFHKRAWTRSRGMRAPIERKTSHIKVGVAVREAAVSGENK